MLSPKYRLARTSDISSLIELRLAMMEEVGHGGEAVRLRQELREYFERNIPSGEFLAYVAEDDGRIIATSGMVFHQNPPSGTNHSGRLAYIMNMYTVPEFRGRGIAAEILQKLLDAVRQMSVRHVSLHAIPKARSIYERAGFNTVETEMRLELPNE